MSDPEDCALDLELMFADIETTLKQIQNGDRKLENNGQWRSYRVKARRPKGKSDSKGGKGDGKQKRSPSTSSKGEARRMTAVTGHLRLRRKLLQTHIFFVGTS